MAKTREEILATKREWQRKDRAANPEKYRADYRKRNKKRDFSTAQNVARKSIYWATKLGFVVRPEKCEGCGRVCKVSAHHADYSKPLDVEWLCNSCHGIKHRKQAR